MTEEKYNDIKPYSDEQIPQAMARIASDPAFDAVSNYLYPDKPLSYFREMALSCRNTNEFQERIMCSAVFRVLEMSAGKLTFGGLENFTPGRKYLLMSNHRDIVLDSAIIQAILFKNGIQTTEMAAGDNLLSSPFIEDLGRSNKMIKVLRKNISPRELYSASMMLSGYMRESITSGKSSVWIAQRNGRTKDGLDLTEQGLLKMLQMSGKDDFLNDFAELNIMPVSISYEYESCDFFKSAETYIKQRQKYVKGKDEDFISILTGIRQYKGDIHIQFNTPMSIEEISSAAKMDKNERFQTLAAAIDSKIISNYRLHKTNYIAYDIVNKTNKYANKYSKEEASKFIEYMQKGLSKLMMKERLEAYKPDGGEAIEFNPAELEDIFLKIYSNPVLAKE